MVKSVHVFAASVWAGAKHSSSDRAGRVFCDLFFFFTLGCLFSGKVPSFWREQLKSYHTDLFIDMLSYKQLAATAGIHAVGCCCSDGVTQVGCWTPNPSGDSCMAILSPLCFQALTGPCWLARSQLGTQRVQTAAVFPLGWVSQLALPSTGSRWGCQGVFGVTEPVLTASQSRWGVWSKNHMQ